MVSMRFFRDIPMQKTNYYKQNFRWFPFTSVYVGRFYDDVIQRKLRRFKFVHNTVDSVYFESIFRELIEENGYKNISNSVIVYPPISLKDRIFRWPNHARKLAIIFAKIIGSNVVVCPFRKKFFAGHQSRRNKTQRSKIQQEFKEKSVYGEQLRGKHIFFIDDIITTGHTAYTLWLLLKHLWVEEITWFFLASRKI